MTRRGWVLFATMSVIWGIPYLLIKIAVAGLPVPVLVLARVAIGAALLLPVALHRRELRALVPYWRWLAVFAVVEIISPWFLLSEAERRLSSSRHSSAGPACWPAWPALRCWPPPASAEETPCRSAKRCS